MRSFMHNYNAVQSIQTDNSSTLARLVREYNDDRSHGIDYACTP